MLVATDIYCKYIISKSETDIELSRQVQKVIFNPKLQELFSIKFIYSSVNDYSKQKQPEILLDFKLDFQQHCQY